MQKLSRLAGIVAIAALCVPAAATAQSQYGYGYNEPVRNTACERQRKDDKVAGALVGAVAGGLIGGAIGNNIDDGDAHWHRGRRGYGHHRGHRGYYHGGNGNSDEVAAGAILGAIFGGIAGSAIADDSARPCAVATPYNYPSGYPANGAYPQGSIPRTTDGLYGGPETLGRTTYPNAPVRTYPASSQPGPTYPQETYPAPEQDQQECRTIERETRMPDGQVIREPLTACRDPESGRWAVVSEGDYGY